MIDKKKCKKMQVDIERRTPLKMIKYCMNDNEIKCGKVIEEF